MMVRVILGAALVLGASAAWADDIATSAALPVDGLQFVGFYVANDAHLFEQQGLAVKQVVIAGIGSFNAVVAGSIDFSFSSGASLARAASHGQRMLAIANMNNEPSWTIEVRGEITEAAHFDPKAPLATRAKILAGRTISVQSYNSVEHAYLKIIAKEGGIDPDSITVAPMQPQDAMAALSRKAIDGLVSAPPWAQQAEVDLKTVPIASGFTGDPAWMKPMSNSIVVTRPQLCAEHREICVKMGHAMAASAKLIHDQPDVALGILKKRFASMNQAVIDSSFVFLRRATPEVPNVSVEGLENGDRINIDAGFMKPEEKLKSYDGLYSNEFLR